MTTPDHPRISSAEADILTVHYLQMAAMYFECGDVGRIKEILRCSEEHFGFDIQPALTWVDKSQASYDQMDAEDTLPVND